MTRYRAHCSVQASSRHYLTAVWRPWIPSPNSSPQDLHAIYCNVGCGAESGFVCWNSSWGVAWLIADVHGLSLLVCVCVFAPFHLSFLFLLLSWIMNPPPPVNIKQHQHDSTSLNNSPGNSSISDEAICCQEKMRFNTIAWPRTWPWAGLSSLWPWWFGPSSLWPWCHGKAQPLQWRQALPMTGRRGCLSWNHQNRRSDVGHGRVKIVDCGLLPFSYQWWSHIIMVHTLHCNGMPWLEILNAGTTLLGPWTGKRWREPSIATTIQFTYTAREREGDTHTHIYIYVYTSYIAYIYIYTYIWYTYIHTYLPT